MAACAVDRYDRKVLAAIVYTDKVWRDAALPVSPFEERASCKLADCLTEVALTEYSEGQLIAVDPRLVVLAPFTVPQKGGKKELLSRGRGWKDEVRAFYPSHSVHDALTVMGLFILNRFRDITREEVVAMLEFDLMDTVAGRQVYEEGLEKGLEKGLLEEARDMVIEALGERFSIVPGEVIDTVRSIGRREVLKDLHRLAIRSRHIEEFKEMLARAA
jgi:hypothetical protein